MGAPTAETARIKTGITVLGEVPWGSHLFFFYETKEDLLDALVPYFKAGLENHEFCALAISEPLTREEVVHVFSRAIPQFQKDLSAGHMEIFPGSDFYLNGDQFDRERVLKSWKEKINRALARGYAGLRASGSGSWLEEKDWGAFCEYEMEVNEAISGQKMIVLCSYPLAGRTAAEIMDVSRTHQFAIVRRDQVWEVIETSQLAQAKAEIKKLNEELEERIAERTRQLTAVNEDLRMEMIERQRAEGALQDAQARLAHVARLLTMGELVAAIAHEVHQPLTGVVTNASFSLRELAGAAPNLEKLRGAITDIVEDGTRASAIISGIRAMLMKGAPNRTEVDLNEVVQEVAILLRHELTQTGASLRTDLAADLPRVYADRVQLQQVLINLVMNGIDAVRTITDRPRQLLIQSEKHPDGVLIGVEDSGRGLDPEQAGRIFEPFYTTKHDGIGMGLSICRSIIESHGGRLWAVLGANGGLFQFTLPTSASGGS
jgi:C4-dicarboxylate-specific signal transduction histidine kinase